ncbi:hypothetical protein A2344_00465 [Candidatus Peregrinibacteria bacterium RIFOXYB12_FULL_41_12]|nr:MAG: hypothetical protein A2244_01220 [Candidatus Peregrinibacteria bacterium RIFOXYA2_FULL_41_18]OGJ48995.1 MAG: hypothetical protein A2344_00465 [Candidatus Peregrinibacteria bacterium RIFOXYB12_FULL_41_12]
MDAGTSTITIIATESIITTTITRQMTSGLVVRRDMIRYMEITTTAQMTDATTTIIGMSAVKPDTMMTGTMTAMANTPLKPDIRTSNHGIHMPKLLTT